MRARVLIMAGGTGGHVYPALAVAEELRERGAEVSWLGTRRGLEAELVPKAGYAIDWLAIQGLRGKGWRSWLLAPPRLLRALWQAMRVMHRRRPAVVLGMGGFVTGAGGVAAWLSGRPLLVHEQNALPGLTNRLLARVARRVLVAFPQAFAGHPRRMDVGNPLRRVFLGLPAPGQRLAGRRGRLRVLVVGGSLGAVRLNQVVPQALARFDAESRPEVLHQTGKRNLDQARQAYRQAGVEADVRPYLDDMVAAYQWADLVICRAGALTVAELAAVGVAAILVPFPHAVDDHQTRNAEFLSQAGAALLLPQQDLDAASLHAHLRQLAGDRARLLAMAEAARALGRPDAARRVAQLCLEVAGV